MPEGGYFLWLDLAEDVEPTELLAAAMQEGVGFIAGPDFMLEGGARSLRLSFASVPPDADRRGRRRARRALDGASGRQPGLSVRPPRTFTPALHAR